MDFAQVCKSLIQENDPSVAARLGSAATITDEDFKKLSSDAQRSLHQSHTIHLVASGKGTLLPDLTELRNIGQMSKIFDILTPRPVHGKSLMCYSADYF